MVLPEVPETFPVTLPVSGPEKELALTLPEESTPKFVKFIVPVVPKIALAPTFIAFVIFEPETSMPVVNPPVSD